MVFNFEQKPGQTLEKNVYRNRLRQEYLLLRRIIIRVGILKKLIDAL